MSRLRGLKSKSAVTSCGRIIMINGAHIVLYTSNPEADRAFFRDVLQFPFIDAGHGWLIFALPSAEAAFHGSQKEGLEKESLDKDAAVPNEKHELFFMCDDIGATLRDLQQKNVAVSAVNEQRWGSLATLTLPGGGKVGIYQPKHPLPPRGKAGSSPKEPLRNDKSE